MAKTVSLTLPHDLTQDEARARLQKGIADLRTSYGARIAQVDETWTANHMDFRMQAAGQQVSGRLDVLPHEVKLDVDLPWMLAMLAGRFRQQVEHEGRRMLEGPANPSGQK